MSITVTFPDAETLVCAYLKDHLAAVGDTRPVSTRIPKPRPGEFYRLLRSGGPRETRVTDAARITIEAWAATEPAAATMLNRVRAVLSDANSTLFGVVEYGGPVNLPDPTTNQVRYTASFTIRVRALQ